MSERVLFVDDEPNILDGIRRQLRKKVDVDTANSGEEGLRKVSENEPYAVVISDMRMPQMNGSTFLAEVRKKSPDSVRMILSGQAELESTIDAVNDGHIFRFLTKPCSKEALFSAVEGGIAQYRLVLSERELLEQTLSGAVRLLTEILGMINPAAYSRAARIQRYANDIATAIGVHEDWQFRLGAMLSQIGCITLPDDTLARIYAGQSLSAEDQKLYESHPQLAGKLLSSIPRLEGVAEMISKQMCDFDLAGLPESVGEWDIKILGAVIIRAATDLDDNIANGDSAAEAIDKLEKRVDVFPEQLRQVFRSIRIDKDQVETKPIKASQLVLGMVLDEDMMSANGMRLMPRGQEVTHSILVRLRSIYEGVGIVEPFRVKVLR